MPPPSGEVWRGVLKPKLRKHADLDLAGREPLVKGVHRQTLFPCLGPDQGVGKGNPTGRASEKQGHDGRLFGEVQKVHIFLLQKLDERVHRRRAGDAVNLDSAKTRGVRATASRSKTCAARSSR